MLKTLGVGSLDELVQQTIPQGIRLTEPVELTAALSESDALAKLKKIMSKNIVNRSLIGMGYYEDYLISRPWSLT
jgi:glycine dehydrogenase